MKTEALALMETASHAFGRGYSGQQEITPPFDFAQGDKWHPN